MHYCEKHYLYEFWSTFCEAPNCIALLYSIHVQHEKAYFLHITLLQWSKELAEVSSVSQFQTTSAAQFKIFTLPILLCD